MIASPALSRWCVGIAGAVALSASLVRHQAAAQQAVLRPAAPVPGVKGDGKGDAKEDEKNPPDSKVFAGLLVRANPETLTDLEDAARLVNRGHFAEALEKYEALMQVDKDAVFPIDKNRFVPVLEEIQKTLGRLPREGLAIYRGKVDGEANRLLELYKREGDLESLLAVVTRYRHSTFGLEAVDLAAERFFDSAEFTRAARLWERRWEEFRDDEPARRAWVGTRLAVAYSESGQADAARRTLERLRKDHPEAGVSVGGRRVSAVGFLENYLKNPLSPAGRKPAQTLPGVERLSWPGSPDSRAVMGEADVVLQYRWLNNMEAARAADNRIYDDKSLADRYQRGANTGFGNMAKPAEGKVEYERPIPAVAGNLVFFRYHDRVRAVELYSGRLRWEHAFPFAEGGENTDPRFAHMNNQRIGPVMLERGRSSVTIAGDRLFTVERFGGTYFYPYYFRPGGGEAGSVLNARRLDTGDILWSVGRGSPKTEAGREATDIEKILAGSTYLTAPTYSEGRLFVIVEYAETYQALCLDAATGAPLWNRFLSVKPQGVSKQPGIPAQGWTSMGSPPAVAGGTVYCLTNAGTLCALEEHTGRVGWILQYSDTPRSSGGANQGFNPGAYNPLDGVGRPPNPVIVAGGRIVVLPSDSDHLMAVNAHDGAIAWKVARQVSWEIGSRRSSDIKHLAGLVDDRVVIAGPDAAAFQLADGKLLWKAVIDGRTAGRPALSEKTLYLSVENQGVARIGVRNGRLLDPLTLRGSTDERRRVPVPLGNLLTLDGKMISCSTLASSAFFSFQEGYDDASKRIAAKPEDPAGWLARGEVSFGAVSEKPERIREALADFVKARELAGKTGDKKRIAECDSVLYEMHTYMGEREADVAARRTLFEQALARAVDDRQRAEGRLHLAEALCDVKAFAEAGRFVQSVAADLPEVTVDDSPRADRVARGLTDTRPARPSHRSAQEWIGKLIAAHGRAVYAEFDKLAEDLFAKASTGADIAGLERILDVYPHSASSDDCLLRLGVLYRDDARKLLGEGVDADKRYQAARLLGRAVQRLEKLAIDKRFAESPLRAGATAGRMAIAMERKSTQEAQEWFARLSKLPADTKVDWPDYAGSTASAVMDRAGKQLYPRGLPARLTVTGLPGDLVGPLEKLQELGKSWAPAGSRLLRDPDGRPVAADDGVIVLTPSGLSLGNPRSGELTWRAVEGRTVAEQAGPVPAVGQVVGDQVAFWDGRGKACGVDLMRGRMRAVLDVTAGASVGNLALARGAQGGIGFHRGMAAYISFGANNTQKLQVIDIPGNRALASVDLGQRAGIAYYNGRPLAPAVGDWGVAAVTAADKFSVYEPVSGKLLFTGPVNGAPAGLEIFGELLLVSVQPNRAGVQGGVTAYGSNGKKLWDVPCPNLSDLAMVTAVDYENVYISMCRRQPMSGELLCVSAADGKTRWSLAMNKIDDVGPRYAIHTAVSDGRLYVVASVNTWPQPQIPAQQSYLQRPVLACINAADGTVVWKQPVDQGTTMYSPVSPPTVTPTQVMICTRHQQTMATHVNVFDRESGRPLIRSQAITGPYANNGTDQRWQKAYWANFPAVVSDLLLVETPDGIEVWGGKGSR